MGEQGVSQSEGGSGVGKSVPEGVCNEGPAGTDSGNSCGECWGKEAGVLEARVPKHGFRPSAREVELHNATHIPFRNWCPFCVAGKAKDNPHFSKEEDRQQEVPVVSMDYTYLEDKEQGDSVAEEEEGDDDDREVKKRGMPVLVVCDRRSKYITSTVVPKKGPHPYAVKSLGRDIRDIMGYQRLIIKDDQEPAILALRQEVKKECQLEILNEESPVADSQGNGEVENAVQRSVSHTRTVKCCLESRIREKLDKNSDWSHG